MRVTKPNFELKTVVLSSLSKSALDALKDMDRHDFKTLNAEADLYLMSGLRDVYKASDDLINKLGIYDLRDFINELRRIK